MTAVQIPELFSFMHKKVSTDTSWQVQEILAQAFDRYCKDTGYEKSLPVIKQWLKDKNPNVKRAVSEGLRIWNTREYFKQHPEVAIELLSQLKDDTSEYVSQICRKRHTRYFTQRKRACQKGVGNMGQE